MFSSLGYLAMFNPFWPEYGNKEDGDWEINLAIPEQRKLALMLFRLGSEKGTATDGRIVRAVLCKDKEDEVTVRVRLWVIVFKSV